AAREESACLEILSCPAALVSEGGELVDHQRQEGGDAPQASREADRLLGEGSKGARDDAIKTGAVRNDPTPRPMGVEWRKPQKGATMNIVENQLASILSRSWWALLLRGLVAIAFGVLTWIQPGISLATLVLLFGAYAV